MIPSAINSDYPNFVPNQVLTSDNLNDLFGYLDEQQRITRTNLLGIGIVCGLQIKTGTDKEGSFITITKGAGVTSQGYLVTVPELTYHFYNQFDAVKPAYYNLFVKPADKKQKMPLWELKQSGEVEDKDNPFLELNDPKGFLSTKVVMLFVELLATNNKNCDPNSCDDKGIMVTVNFRPLLILKTDVEAFLLKNSNQSLHSKAILLKEVKMPRFDVGSTLLLDTEDVLKAYQVILTKSFIQSVKDALSDSWNRLFSLLADEFPGDPFMDLETNFTFLSEGPFSQKQAVNIQYFYDLFSDLLAAYEELKRKAFKVACECIPDENLFPRHLLVGEANGFSEQNSEYRTLFIPSPVVCSCAEDADELKSLFRKLVLMIDNFSLDISGNEEFRKKGTPVKITPSLLGREPLSEKAIPFYYTPNEGNKPLYLSWNYKKTSYGIANQILSYNSGKYNTTDEFVKHPLKYDLEPNNFLRIEGHIGLDYRIALAELDKQKKGSRLPIDVIALSSDTRGIFSITSAISNMDTAGSIAAAFEIMIKHPSCFSDIFLALDEWINKLRCCLLESKGYFNRLPSYKTRVVADNTGKKMAIAGGMAGDFTPDPEETIGKLYEEKLKDGSITDKYCGDVFVDIATNKMHHATALVMMPYMIDSMIAVLPEHITQLDAKALELKYNDLTTASTQLRTMYASSNVSGTMVDVDMAQLSNRLEMSCLVCLFLELKLLIREFLLRLLGLMIRQKLGFYAFTNPGIQHKAGVPVGGTFILVYHEVSATRKAASKKEFISAFKNVITKDGQTAASLFSGDQPLLSSILLLEELLFLQKVVAAGDETNEVLDKIIESIEPGTVIADFYVPYLCTSSCAPSQMVVMPAQEKFNQPPVARAGDSISIQLPNNQVTLDGSRSSDPDGTILTYKWNRDSGPETVAIVNPDSATTLVTDFVEGDYVFKLTVTDNDGAVNEDTVSVKVMQKQNISPKAFASVDKPLVILGKDSIARLKGDNSFDPDGIIEGYLWELKSGPAGGSSVVTPSAPSTNVRFTKVGQYTFSLIVTDNMGATGSAETSVVVMEPQNMPPVADAGEDRKVYLKSGNDSFVLDGSNSSDPEGGPLTFLWVKTSGPNNPVITYPTQPVTAITVLQQGEYKFMLTVTDNKGASASDTVSIGVKIEEEVSKICGPLSGIISEFEILNQQAVNSDPFKDFFKYYQYVVDYFQALSGIVAEPVEQQIEFFRNNSAPDLLYMWLERLNAIIKENKGIRLLSLKLYRILNLLSMYIVCIQGEDFDKATVQMSKVFDLIRSNVEKWKSQIIKGVFTNQEIAVVKNIGNDIETEIKRVIDNGEQGLKPKYIALLTIIYDIIKSLP